LLISTEGKAASADKGVSKRSMQNSQGLAGLEKMVFSSFIDVSPLAKKPSG